MVVSGPALAIRPDEMLANPKLEARARQIDKELRCLVCQNESIDDSDADLAHDLRLLVRRRLLAGDTDAQVKQYVVARYGDYVLLKPPFDPETWLLWLGPLALFGAAAAAATVYFRRNHAASQVAPLSAEEHARLAELLGISQPGKGDRE
ncbi:MAG: cytochrome c-type biogenesis protein CcmH [Alphaproteobacteria bacterium]|nr:cytochrome c-type biogenesis protein CcmH [Alphaproteobacteria bacterium]MBU6471565.1 cytochrome c-type biogenesis protein CcmH [Alphaproteobacteria bacterium]MDE2014380.1 cytochrome c-type biogenesis protein CcmH [Alphaproteobacteria bacterium]MDE2074505.1 cytochrome c-type biogenesis protein CcmH [Alphaproteobacteria bacterium]MDE2351412.1 cytochrome c-type biogenesis protein CcmH [Alphaproteobacteria bacterium]